MESSEVKPPVTNPKTTSDLFIFIVTPLIILINSAMIADSVLPNVSDAIARCWAAIHGAACRGHWIAGLGEREGSVDNPCEIGQGCHAHKDAEQRIAKAYGKWKVQLDVRPRVRPN